MLLPTTTFNRLFPTEVIGDAWFAVVEFEGRVLELRKVIHLSFHSFHRGESKWLYITLSRCMEQIVWARSQIYWRNCIDRQSGFIESYQDQWSWLILPGEVFIVERLVSPAVASCWLLDATLIKSLTTIAYWLLVILLLLNMKTQKKLWDEKIYITYCNKELCWKTSSLNYDRAKLFN